MSGYKIRVEVCVDVIVDGINFDDIEREVKNDSNKLTQVVWTRLLDLFDYNCDRAKRNSGEVIVYYKGREN